MLSIYSVRSSDKCCHLEVKILNNRIAGKKIMPERRQWFDFPDQRRMNSGKRKKKKCSPFSLPHWTLISRGNSRSYKNIDALQVPFYKKKEQLSAIK